MDHSAFYIRHFDIESTSEFTHRRWPPYHNSKGNKWLASSGDGLSRRCSFVSHSRFRQTNAMSQYVYVVPEMYKADACRKQREERHRRKRSWFTV